MAARELLFPLDGLFGLAKELGHLLVQSSWSGDFGYIFYHLLLDFRFAELLLIL